MAKKKKKKVDKPTEYEVLFGEHVFQRRNDMELSQGQLASKIINPSTKKPIHVQTIKKWEAGRLPDVHLIKSIEKAFGCKYYELLIPFRN